MQSQCLRRVIYCQFLFIYLHFSLLFVDNPHRTTFSQLIGQLFLSEYV